MSAIGLPVNILAHFVPRPPIPYEKSIPQRNAAPLSGMSQYLCLFEDDIPPPREPFETPRERRQRLGKEKRSIHQATLVEARQHYRPTESTSILSDPYKTLFVGRLAYETTERVLRRVFEEWGNIKGIKIVTDREGRSRGYAFIEYEHERDLKDAYKYADGIKVDGRYVLVDVERGRTVPDWLPRRLGGGKGPGRISTRPRQKKRKAAQMDRRGPTRGYPDAKRARSPPRHSHGGYPRDGRGDNRDYSRRSSYNW